MTKKLTTPIFTKTRLRNFLNKNLKTKFYPIRMNECIGAKYLHHQGFKDTSFLISSYSLGTSYNFVSIAEEDHWFADFLIEAFRMVGITGKTVLKIFDKMETEGKL